MISPSESCGTSCGSALCCRRIGAGARRQKEGVHKRARSKGAKGARFKDVGKTFICCTDSRLCVHVTPVTANITTLTFVTTCKITVDHTLFVRIHALLEALQRTVPALHRHAPNPREQGLSRPRTRISEPHAVRACAGARQQGAIDVVQKAAHFLRLKSPIFGSRCSPCTVGT